MTEAEWLACENPWAMLDHLGATTERKWRYVLVACCRALMHMTPNERVLLALDAAERYADGRLTASTLRRYRQKIGRVNSRGTGYETAAFPMAERHATNLCIFAATSHGSAGPQPIPQALRGGLLMGDFPHELLHCMPPILRDIFGNPFRSVIFAPDWRTDTAITLAHNMYDSRDFSAMPILADALQDAGCDSDDILNHCRQPGVHVRGCWLVDLILAKS